MSVITPIIDSIDGGLRRIYLKAGVSDYFPVEDLYREYRNLRRTDESLRKWSPLLKVEGNVSKGGGAYTPRYMVLLEGTKIVPFNESIPLNQLGDIITDDPDTDATIYDVSTLAVAKPIYIKPSESEIRIQTKQIEDVKFLIETLRPHHTGFGDIYYWDPVAGSDLNTGNTKIDAVKTFVKAHSLAQDGHHDIIVCVSSAVSQVVVDENLEITKNYLFIRGPGRDFKMKPTATDKPTVSINAIGVELSGMIIDTADTGGQNAIEIQSGADFFFIDNLWSNEAQHAAVYVNGSVVYGRINECFFSHSGSDGIHINGDVRHTRITNTELDSSGGHGIHIEGATARNNIIGNGVKIYGSTGYGIQVDNPATRNFIDSDVSLYDNALGDILDNGITTVNERSTGSVTAQDKLDIAEEVWKDNEVYADENSKGYKQDVTKDLAEIAAANNVI